MNPRRSKRSRKKRRSNPNMKRNSKGRFVKRSRASNPRKRRRKHNPHRAKHHRRKRRAVAVSNPRRRKRRHNPRRHRARHRRHRNPRFGVSRSDLTGQLMPAAIGGVGALINSVILGYVAPLLVPIVPFMTTGYGLHALRIGSSLGLGILGKKFGGAKGAQAGEGALTVAMYLLFRDVAVAFAPTLPLGDYEEIAIDGTDQIGAYMDPAARLGAYMSGARLPDGSRKTPGMGAYMSGRLSADSPYEGEADGFNLAGIDY
jgi:hypothetical protein